MLCIAGAAKICSPGAALRALQAIGIPATAAVVVVLGAFELGVGAWCLLVPGPVAAATAAATFTVFAVVARLLAARGAACGCFGESEREASPAQCVLSAALAGVCVAAAVRAPLSLQWIVGRPVGLAAVLLISVAGCAYAIVVAYTLLPAAWGAWSPR